MARPPLPLGTPGAITTKEESPGVWVARCRFRDHDGVTRRLWKQGPSKTAARAALHQTIQDRQRKSLQSVLVIPLVRLIPTRHCWSSRARAVVALPCSTDMGQGAGGVRTGTT
jgi:hypothetical protein